jgi:hypothetical protein
VLMKNSPWKLYKSPPAALNGLLEHATRSGFAFFLIMLFGNQILNGENWT